MNINQLSKSLLKSHRKTKSWNITGKDFGITGGLAYRIAIHKYEPAHKDIREKLNLNPRPCPTCGRRIVSRSTQPKKLQPSFMKAWKKLPTNERQKVIMEYIKWRKK